MPLISNEQLHTPNGPATTGIGNEMAETMLPENILPPRTSPKILGHDAVRASFDIAREDVGEEILHDYLQVVRNNFRDTDPLDKKRVATNIFTVQEMPEWLLGSLGGAEITPEQRFDRITATDENGKDIVSDETLINFLEWHAHRTEQKQIAFEKNVVTPLRLQYVERFKRAIKAGWIPADTLDEKRLSKIMETPVLLDDGFGGDEALGRRWAVASAYARAETSEPMIVFRHGSEKMRPNSFDRLFTHEMTHIITGTVPESVRRTVAETARMGNWGENPDKPTYGLSRVFGDGHIGVTINEAVTEHFAVALIKGDIDSLRIVGRGGTYMNNRYLFRKLCNGGKIKISPRLFVQAMFDGSSYSESGKIQTPAVEELKRVFQEAFPQTPRAIEVLSQTPQEHPISGGSITVRGVHRVIKGLNRGTTS